MNHTHRNLTENARKLRKNQTDAERVLWRHLRTRNLMNLKFKRQVPIGDYIVDFLCYEKNLIIEVDGGQHAEQQVYDQKRKKWLESQGFKVIRFWNHDVLKNLDGVAEKILECCGEDPHPSPLPQAGEGNIETGEGE